MSHDCNIECFLRDSQNEILAAVGDFRSRHPEGLFGKSGDLDILALLLPQFVEKQKLVFIARRLRSIRYTLNFFKVESDAKIIKIVQMKRPNFQKIFRGL